MSTLSLRVFHNELISVQPPSRILLPCRHSVALNHPKVYKKMWVSWETWILPQLSLTFFSPCFRLLHLTTLRPFWIFSLPFLSLLTPFHLSFHLYSLSLLLSFPLQEVPAVMMMLLNIRGNPRRVSVAFSHLAFCARALVLWITA